MVCSGRDWSCSKLRQLEFDWNGVGALRESEFADILPMVLD
jgi:hypothetical protein